jgi:hypothetical protein
MPTTNFSDDERAAVTRAVRRAIDEDRFPHAPRLALRSAPAKLDPAPARQTERPSGPHPILRRLHAAG